MNRGCDQHSKNLETKASDDAVNCGTQLLSGESDIGMAIQPELPIMWSGTYTLTTANGTAFFKRRRAVWRDTGIAVTGDPSCNAGIATVDTDTEGIAGDWHRLLAKVRPSS